MHAVDDSGTTGVLTRTGTVRDSGTRLEVTVPAIATTGNVSVIGSHDSKLADFNCIIWRVC